MDMFDVVKNFWTVRRRQQLKGGHMLTGSPDATIIQKHEDVYAPDLHGVTPDNLSIYKSHMMMEFQNFLQAIGHEVEDAEEEAFSLFSQELPSQNLGFIDSRSATLDLTVHGRDFEIRQSPTILSSTRAGGTTGAVAEWLSSKQNPLWTSSLLDEHSTVVELGCGISGLIALSLAPFIGHYIATDQEYVHRLLKENLDANALPTNSSSNPSRSSQRHHDHQSHSQTRRARKGGPQTHHNPNTKHSPSPPTQPTSNITFAPLDWELDSPSALKQVISDNINNIHPPKKNSSNHHHRSTPSHDPSANSEQDPGFDLLVACDCIYNDALIDPFVQTCADIARLRPAFTPTPTTTTTTTSENGTTTAEHKQSRSRAENTGADPGSGSRKPTLCVIAQQLRMPDVFESWLAAALGEFRVWRVRDEVVGEGLGGASGYVVHVLVVRE
ncbi:hypothetical protein FQN51_006185 [Onygenales sp. PD_10]|nr:hypothetical protein FQN51_006185 [Onygenales sp. PD_10]